MAQSSKPVALVIGASRGIGRQISIGLADAGYIVVVAAKSISTSSDPSAPFPPDPNSSASTITTVAREITNVHGPSSAIPLSVDVRSPSSVASLFAEINVRLGRLDVLVYNAGAIWWASVQNTPLKRWKLMQEVNAEGLYASVQEGLKLFEKGGWKARVIVCSPPIYSRFFRGKAGYAMGKVGMSVLTKGLAMDWEREGKTDMAITSLWPAVAIESAATQFSTRTEPESKKELRKATIFADALLAVLTAAPTRVNGLLDTDEDFLRRECGMTDFSKYALIPGTTPRRIVPAKFPSLLVDEQDDEGKRMDSTVLFGRTGRETKL